MIKDIGILGGLSIIYFAMVATIIRVALFYQKEERANASGVQSIRHRAGGGTGMQVTEPNVQPETRLVIREGRPKTLHRESIKAAMKT